MRFQSNPAMKLQVLYVYLLNVSGEDGGVGKCRWSNDGRSFEQALLRMDDWLAGWLSGAGTLIKADHPQVQLIHNQADDDFK